MIQDRAKCSPFDQVQTRPLWSKCLMRILLRQPPPPISDHGPAFAPCEPSSGARVRLASNRVSSPPPAICILASHTWGPCQPPPRGGPRQLHSDPSKRPMLGSGPVWRLRAGSPCPASRGAPHAAPVVCSCSPCRSPLPSRFRSLVHVHVACGDFTHPARRPPRPQVVRSGAPADHRPHYRPGQPPAALGS